MNRFRAFFFNATVGGLTVILPAVVLFLLMRWALRWATDLIQPLTNLVILKLGTPEWLADGAVLGVIVSICFILGVTVRTRLGKLLLDHLERRVLGIAPGYGIIRETIMQLLGRKHSPFSRVALVRVYDSPTLMTAFITDDCGRGWQTAFIPTGPNPTTGYIVHLPSDRVFPLAVRVDRALRSVIACGAGSAELLNRFPGLESLHPSDPPAEIPGSEP